MPQPITPTPGDTSPMDAARPTGGAVSSDSSPLAPPAGARDLASSDDSSAGEQARHIADTAKEGAAQAADAVRAGASEMGSQVQEKVGEVKETVMGEARSMASDARTQATQVVGTAQEQLRAQATEQTERLTQTLKDIGRQLGQMADSSDEPDAGVVHLIRGAADQADRTARRLDEGGVDVLVGDVTRFARRHPGTFLLGSLAAGVAVGRIVRHVDMGEVGHAAKDALQPTSSEGGGVDGAGTATDVSDSSPRDGALSVSGANPHDGGTVDAAVTASPAPAGQLTSPAGGIS